MRIVNLRTALRRCCAAQRGWALPLVALSLVVAACSSPPKKVEDTTAKDNAQETCCCKWVPIASEDAKPTYEVGNVMECSAKQGTCVDQVQCEQQNAAEPE